MERVMDPQKRERFDVANQELADFLERIDGLANGMTSVTEKDLQGLSQRLLMLAPEVGDASRGVTLDEELQDEVGKYVKNLRSLQIGLEKLRCVMLARRTQLDNERRHLYSLQEWVNAYNQTT